MWAWVYFWALDSVLLVYQFSSVSQSFPILCDPTDCSTPGLPVHHQLVKSTQTMSIESVMPSNQLILCHPLFLLPSIFPSIRVFSNESVLCIRWPKYWSFSFSISPSNEYSGPISFRMNWDLLAVSSPRDFQGTCDLCCYCVLWLRSQPWIGSKEAPSLDRNWTFGS